MKKLSILASFLLLVACEKEIHIDLNSASPQMVIEGNITDGSGPYTVKLTKTVNFSDGNSFPAVSGAQVIIQDNEGAVDTLSEVRPGAYQTHNLVGKPGNTYQLTVLSDGKKYEAVSKMPQKVQLDSLRFTPFGKQEGKKVYITVPVYKDPSTTTDFYRFVISVKGVVNQNYIVFSDNATNGSVNQRPIVGRDLIIEEGDDVSVEMRCIDQNTYTYFYTLARMTGGGGGGGVTPTNPPNNITGNTALGYFTAYTTQTMVKVVR